MSRRLGNRFLLGQKIGSGGMSNVYLGADEVLDRPVAVKVLKPEFMESDIGARFRREGRTAAKLSHPNIVQVYDAGEDELEGKNASYIVMEHVPGGDLKELVKEKGPLPEKELSRLGADVASGLAHAHDQGIVHRDIKPQNVLLDEYGRPKVTDFGIARALDSTQATQTGVYLGTALYSSPEQLQGETVTAKSDVFSLGITLYEAATGGPPFKGTPIEIISQQINTKPEPPRARGAQISPRLEALILGCLERDPERRPVASELGERLLQAAVAPSAKAGSGVPRG
ncbi:MAG: protein kinase, partial [Rubrobacteraceae bacterium]